MSAPAAARSGVLPLAVRPMLAQAADGPLSSPDHAYEVKWDGMRVLTGIEGGRMSLRTRNDIEALSRFPELAHLPELVSAEQAILDGEIVRLVDGVPSFGALQHRIHLSSQRDIQRCAELEPVSLILFDALHLGEESLLARPWSERRERLEAAVRTGAAVQLSPVFPDGRELWMVVDRLRLEGIMAKRRAGRYYPGKRSPEWLKIKREHTCDVVVGGWTEGTGHRAGMGALIVGIYVGTRLHPLAHVGSGFKDAELVEILKLLPALETSQCPFDPRPVTNGPVHWMRPELVCEVRCLGLGSDGSLRFPVFLRWRPDKGPADCTL